ncbi:Alanine--glyoxylate aminotransferase 2, mitochondrial, partial [Gonapodya sp. JEL0774]
ASPAVQLILSLLLSSPNSGILIPIPQYPLYTASIALSGGTAVPYYLDEENGWRVDTAGIERA